MAERKLDIVIRANDLYSKTLNNFKNSISDTASKVDASSNKMRASFDSLNGSIMGIHAAWLKVAGVVASAAWIHNAAKDALEGEKAFNRLRIQIQNMGIWYDNVSHHVEAAIASTSRYAMVQDDEVAGVLQQLILLTGNYSGSIENLNLVYDLAYQKGIDVSQSAMAISKAMTGNLEALRDLIPEIKNLTVGFNNKATAVEKASFAMDLLRNRVGGAMNQMTEHERKVAEVTLAYTQLKEAIGNVGLEIASLTLKNLKAPFEWLESIKGFINKGAGLINPYAADVETPESKYPFSTFYKGLVQSKTGIQEVNENLDAFMARISKVQDTSILAGSAFSAMFAPVSLSAGNIENPIMAALAGVGTDSGNNDEYFAMLDERYNRELEFENLLLDGHLAYAEQRVQIEASMNQSIMDLKFGAANQSIALLATVGQKSKSLMMAALIAQKALAAAQVWIQTQTASSAALAPPPLGLGPVFGAPLASSIQLWGKVQMGLIAATGLAEVATGGGRGPSGIGGGGGIGALPIDAPTLPYKTEAQPVQHITLNVQSLDPSTVNWDRLMENNVAPALERLSGDRNVELNIKVATR